MSKRAKEHETKREPSAAPPPGAGGWQIATLAAVGILLVLNGMIWSENRKFRRELQDQMESMTASISQVGAKIDTATRAAAPRSGPDPNRVYPVKIDGAPSRGSSGAPVVIAEFSDFQ